ncbi:rhomboid family intramembrane serine protease [Chitinophaga sp. GCM10012297]|uniref:Rhomboid family intramembrane serine protease n=1 Tax=Chitinophaga chungangae TaxID=2821488 RepID=A0ABS3YDL8_9BACT|nr:rhomboid family intramembrane serine protease [Chitinophaga chungangae]MBO9152774.1 rhomboid family intramembrane serine protease [Chitinophaga chungangae]
MVYLAQITLQSSNLEAMFGLHYWGSELFRPHQIITHLFMHGSFAHLFSNMFALWMFGSALENRWGPKRFLIFYMICGIGAALCHMGVLTYDNMKLAADINNFNVSPSFSSYLKIYDKYGMQFFEPTRLPVNIPGFTMQSFTDAWATLPPESREMITYARFLLSDFREAYANVPTVGASGAVFGVLFAFGYLFPNSYLFILPIPFPIKAKYFIGGYILLELFLGFNNSGGDNVAHFAHLGGVLFAYILLKVWAKRNRRDFY